MSASRGGVLLKEYGSLPALFGAAFSPSDVPGYIIDFDASILASLWQDSGQTTPVVSDGDPVGAWVDQGAAGDVVTQSTTAAKPTYRASEATYNNQPAVYFDGGDLLQIASFSSGAITQPFTIFAVCDNDLVSHYFDGGSVNLRFFKSTTQYQLRAGAILGPGGTSDANPHIFALKLNGVSTEVYEDGVSELSGDAGTNALDGVTLGARQTAASWMRGYFTRFLVYTGLLSTGNMNLIQNFLSARYGISVTEFS
jgi:hypothetical protein